MKKRKTKKSIVTNDYIEFLNSIKLRIRSAQISASRVLNKGLVKLYWTIGKDIVDKQEKLGWGKSVVEQLSKDLSREFNGTSGFSTQNLWYMRQFYIEYQEHSNLQQLAGEIPWFSNITILSKVKDPVARAYYLRATAEMGWSRAVLLNQIKAKAYERHQLSSKQHNFQKALPVHLAEQADKAMKDVYMLDFLAITKPVLEREMENRMVVAVELKAVAFQPEFAGKMNFYLNLLDTYVKEKDENPSIGIILCADRDKFEVEFALRGIDKPVGVAEYRLTTKLPKALAGKIPDAKKLKQEIMKELKGTS